MLPPDYLINRIEPITTMYEDFYTAVLIDIARHIRDTLKATGTADLIPSAVYQAEQLQRSGMLLDDIIHRVSEINRMSRSEIKTMFEDAAVKAWEYDERVYKTAGIEPIPIKQSPEMLQVLNAGIEKTLGSVQRLTGTIATNAQDKFEELLNVGYNKTASGTHSSAQAIADATDELAQNGVKVFHYESGKEISVEAAVRMNVLTGVNQTACEVVHQGLIDMCCSLVLVSAHTGARNKGEVPENHEKFQGRVYHWKELEEKFTKPAIAFTGVYKDFIETTGYMKTPKGLAGPNCKHNFGTYIEGLSTNTITQEELDEMATKTVTYNGVEIPYYDATQKLRTLQRKVRDWKRKKAVKEAGGQDTSVEKKKIREWQAKVKNFTDQTGLKRDYKRERIAREK